MIRIALVGQPNAGKSTIFNHLVGYKAHTSNFPGTTVEYLESEAFIDGARAEVIDLPGVYSLTSLDEAETRTRDYLLSRQVDVVLNIIDASLLSRSLELTLQLLELGIPLVVCLNMEDEARRKGIQIDADRLAKTLGVPVVPAIAVRGVGVKRTATAAVAAARAGGSSPSPTYGSDVEATIAAFEDEIRAASIQTAHHPARLIAVKLLDGDPHFASLASARDGGVAERAVQLSADLARRRGKTPEGVISAERHAKAMEIFEEVSTVGKPIVGLRDRIDRLLMHRTLGLFLMAAILYGLFVFVFKVGSLAEGPLIALFDRAIELLGTALPEGGLAFAAVSGLIQGVGGALGIVLPYLVPFLIGLALLEDIGYLPRAGYLADGLMHRIGLHGKSVVPFILGYGCSVPAVMATRILESKRDRFITAMLAVMVPCVARATIVFGLIGYFLGPHLAFLLYVINLIVIAAVGKALTVLLPSVTPGLILEIPSYKIPSPRVIASKVWLRVRHFLRVAVPILVLGSVVLALLEVVRATDVLNLALLPITWTLGLPVSLGVTLIFGIFRKELSLVMLFQALGTTQVLSVLSAGQMMTFTLFVVFYIPCVATLAVLKRELGWRQTGLVVAATTATALLVALLARGIAALVS
ncbi:ferrous iron transport protein B [Candidatus Bipolaricaulota bacterium]